MAEQKRFQKITLNSDDYKVIEKAAKATKIVGTGVAAAGAFVGGVALKTWRSDNDENSDVEEEQEED